MMNDVIFNKMLTIIVTNSVNPTKPLAKFAISCRCGEIQYSDHKLSNNLSIKQNTYF
jgi:hypothetical protein